MKKAICSVVAVSTLFLSACSSPKFPETGVVSQYDGHWAGDLNSKDFRCENITVEFEVRYGFASGTVYDSGAVFADVWGEVGPDGKLAADIGKLGVSGASADIQFGSDAAVGSWKSKHCTGTADLKKVEA